MNAKSIITLIAAVLATGGFTFAREADVGRCGMPRGTCGGECDGSGCLNQGRGNGQGLRLGKGGRNGNGNGNGEQRRERRRDGSGPGCGQGS